MAFSIVTKTGDGGDTGLYSGERRKKDDARIEAYGTVDEFNSVLGVIVSHKDSPEALKARLTTVQHLLFRLGGDLSTPLEKNSKRERIVEADVLASEAVVKELEAVLPEQRRFILPSGSEVGSFLHLARAVCRRAERRLVTLMRTEEVNPWALKLLNRLSDELFLHARKTNIDQGSPETPVQY